MRTEDELRQIAMDKWSIADNRDDVFLKSLAKDIYNNKVFTSNHCRPDEIMMVFMSFALMSPQPPKNPFNTDTIEGNRNHVIWDLLEKDELEKIYDYEHEYFEAFRKNMGMIYEYMDSPNLSPTGINFLPCFYSFQYISVDDKKKLNDFYNQYKEIRELADEF